MEQYICIECKKPVLPMKGDFHHPHMGWSTALVCPYCGRLVMLKEIKPQTGLQPV